MANQQSKSEIITFNGDGSPDEDRILELIAGDDSWNILNITLEKRRTLTSRILIQAMIMDKLLFMNH